jgi:hypothetical protein
MRAKKRLSVYKVVRQVSLEMATMQQTLFEAGLIATAAAVNAASQKLGWEGTKLAERYAREVKAAALKELKAQVR